VSKIVFDHQLESDAAGLQVRHAGGLGATLLGVTVYERRSRRWRRSCFLHYPPTGSLPTLPDWRLGARRHECAIVVAAWPSGTLPELRAARTLARSNRGPIILNRLHGLAPPKWWEPQQLPLPWHWTTRSNQIGSRTGPPRSIARL
jgi:hypothetical protein